MRNFLNPKWLFIINTLPIVILFFLFLGQFNIIKTLLDEGNLQAWKSYGCTLGLLAFLNFAYAVYLTLKKQNVSVWYGIIALLCYIPFIYLYGYNINHIIPSSIPQWMVSGNIFLYVGTFLMPTLAYALFVLVKHFTSESKEHKAWVNILIAVSVPIVGYLYAQIILPLWEPFDREFNTNVFLILIIAGTILFLFFLIRAIYIIVTKKAAVWQEYQLAWKIPIAIVLPLLGLAVNNGQLFDNFGADNTGIFGNFNNIWFYILAVVNGTLICLPNPSSNHYRLALFIGRSITFTYTFYFFLVFLPFLPLSVVAIIAIGTGFLMLTPLLLFIIHCNELSKDFIFLNEVFSKKLILGISFLGFMIIPAFITVTYLNDKKVLNETLGYLYSPDYSKQYNIDRNSLKTTLNVIKNHKGSNRDFLFGNHIPYFSTYFNWLVLDNLTLSNSKINDIENIFFEKTSYTWRSENIQNDSVEITNIKTNSTYDKSQNAWKSWVDLEITNKSDESRFAEYATTLNLPEGCWISDYYLFVGDKKEPGILSEKKSAMWVFSQIRNTNRDPGILYYLTGNKVAFRVFPFAKDEVRKTGIEFLHKEPIQLKIDGNIIDLGNAAETVNEKVETENVVYVSAKQKQSLTPVQRKPYFHFLVDASNNKSQLSANFTKRIEQAIENNKSLSENAQISFVNSYVNSFPLNSNWKQIYQAQQFEGGFYLDRAIKTTLVNARKSKSYPVMVVVTDSMKDAILNGDFSDFRFAFPESNLFYNLSSNGTMQPYSLVGNPQNQLPDSIPYSFDKTVLEYKLSDNSTVYLPDNKEPAIILKTDIFETSESEIKEKNWQSALEMQGNWRSQVLHPELSDKQWVNLVNYSFISKVMTPVTSYLVVENEAQKAMLNKKQEHVLSSNKSLDVGEDAKQMSEPNLVLLAILLGFVLWYKQKRKRLLSQSQ